MCQDYIYDKDMEQIAKEEQRKAWKLQGLVFLPEFLVSVFFFLSCHLSMAKQSKGKKELFRNSCVRHGRERCLDSAFQELLLAFIMCATPTCSKIIFNCKIYMHICI